MTKEQVITSLQDLPDSFELEDLFERLVLIERINEGLEQVKRGEVVTVDEAKQRLAKWLI